MSTLPRFETIPLPCNLAAASPMTDAEFEEMCLKEDWIQYERTSEGVIRMNPPAGILTGDGNAVIIHLLYSWWDTHQKGRVFDSNTGFFLPDGSMLSPDAGYLLPEQLKGLTKNQFKGFLRRCPAFVVELLSATDSLAETRRKMENWIANGAQLGWLVDPYRRLVTVYQHGQPPRESSALQLDGSGPVQGFTLDLAKVWRCYEIPSE
jgi:Uma2 family endonuclease